MTTMEPTRQQWGGPIPRLGVRARLLLAFALVAGFSLLAAAAGVHAFRTVGARLDVIDARVPPALAALELSRSAERITTAAPALLTAADGNHRDEVKAALATEADRLAAALAAMAVVTSEGSEHGWIAAEVDALTAGVAALDEIVNRRDETGRRLAAVREQLFRLNADVQGLLGPWLEVTELEVAAALEVTDQDDGLAARIRRQRDVQAAQRQVATVVDVLAETLVTTRADRLPVLSFQVDRALHQAAEIAAELDPRLASHLATHLSALAALATGPDSIADLRGREIGLIAQGERLVGEAAARSKRLSAAVDDLGVAARTQVSGAVEDALSVQRASTRLLAVLVVLSFASSVLIVWLFVSRRILRRLMALGDEILAIATGRLGTPVIVEGADEITDMARAVEEFRRNTVERDALIAEKAGAAARLEEEVQQRTEELKARTGELELANSRKLHVIVAASHDLRQPLHALGLFVSQLRATPEGAVRDRLIERAEAAAGSVNELFAALLDLSKLETGGLSPELRTLPLRHLMSRIESTFAEAARAKGLAFAVVPSSLAVRTDPVLMERILFNLVSNAIRYTRQGGVVVGARRRGSAVRLDVVDTGPGVPASERESIFTEFRRGAEAAEGGLGLGLAIVDRLCRLLDHPVELRTEIGRGSRFSVVAPVAAPVSRFALPAEALPNPARGRLVVLVEDDPLVTESMAGLLRSWGCRVISARSGEALLAGLARRRRPPDLVIADHCLPGGIDGMETIRQVRASCGRKVPAMLVSGDAGAKLGLAARREGVPLLLKPIPAMRLRAAVTGLLGH